jgi:hypothetical protein
MIKALLCGVLILASCNLPSSGVKEFWIRSNDPNVIRRNVEQIIKEDEEAMIMLRDYEEQFSNAYGDGDLFSSIPGLHSQAELQLSQLHQRYLSGHERTYAMRGLAAGYMALVTCSSDPVCNTRIGKLMQDIIDNLNTK